MSDGTIFPKIKIELIIFLLKTDFLHSLEKLIVIIFTLTAADYLADEQIAFG